MTETIKQSYQNTDLWDQYGDEDLQSSAVSRQLSSLMLSADLFTLRICEWFNLPKTTCTKWNMSALQQSLVPAAARNCLCSCLLKQGVHSITLLWPVCGISSAVIVLPTKMWAFVMDALLQRQCVDEKLVLIPPVGTDLQYCSSKLCILN